MTALYVAYQLSTFNLIKNHTNFASQVVDLTEKNHELAVTARSR